MRDPIRKRVLPDVKHGRDGLVQFGSLHEFAMDAITGAGLVPEGIPAVPWYTPVIGSGPTGLPRDFYVAAPHLADAIRLKVLSAPYGEQLLQVGEGDPVAWLGDFVAGLVEDRAGTEIRMAGGEASVSAADLAERFADEAVWMAVVAALMTRVFHRVSLDVSRPIGPWGSDSAELSTGHPRWARTQEEFIQGLVSWVTWCRDALKGRPNAKRFPQLGKLLNHIAENAVSGRIVLHELQQVTEVAWLLIVESFAERPYPGWTELMLQLLLEDAEGVDKRHRRHRLRDLEHDAMTIRRVLHESTAASWRGVESSIELIENREFYDSAASVLWAQQEFAVRNDPVPTGKSADPEKVVHSPHAAAFATAFDFELEMALWRTAPEAGGRFSIILPTYLLDGPTEKDGAFLWLLGTIEVPPRRERAARALDDYDKALAVTAWAVVRTGRELPKHPIVVRLGGCPLVDIGQVPRSGEVLADLARLGLADGSRSQGLKLIHSIAVDEYLAVRQTGAEWLWGAIVNSKSDGRGLPKSLTLTTEQEPVRYWMLMGVPIKDPAIRMRILAVLARDDTPSEARSSSVDEEPDTTPIRADAGRESRPVSTADAHLLAAGIPLRPEPSGGGAEQKKREPAEGGTVKHEVYRNHRIGVAINTRCDDEEVMLLQSLGFAVVQDRCEHYSKDMQEYAVWLADQNLPSE